MLEVGTTLRRNSQLLVSLITVRAVRPWYTEVELRSLACQSLGAQHVQIVLIDDSPGSDVARVLKPLALLFGEVIYIHLSGWRNTRAIYYEPNARRVLLSMHFNEALQRARAPVVLLEGGEYLHHPDSLASLVDPVLRDPYCICHAQVRDLRLDAAQRIARGDDMSPIWQDETSWGSWLMHPTHTPLYDEMTCASCATALLRRIGGLDAGFMDGWQNDVAEVYRRMLRAGAVGTFTDRHLVAHIEHDRADQLGPSHRYRASHRNKVKHDQGYWSADPKVKYCRPGTEKRPIVVAPHPLPGFIQWRTIARQGASPGKGGSLW